MLHVQGRPPTWLRIVEPLHELDRGSHRPVSCRMETLDGHDAGIWVVKPPISIHTTEGRNQLQVLAELVGAEVAAWFDVPTPAIGLVELTPPNGSVWDGMPKTARELFRQNAGQVAFCSRFLEPAVELEPLRYRETTRGRDLLRTYGARLLALDTFLLHRDRTTDRPNAFEWNGRLVAFDHGGAFAQFTERGAALADVVAPEALQVYLNHHVCGEAVRLAKRPVDLGDIVERVRRIGDDEIATLENTWPVGLDSERTRSNRRIRGEMRKFLLSRRDHIEDIVKVVSNYIEGAVA